MTRIDVHDVAAHAAGDGHGRKVIAAGVAPGREPLLDQPARGRDQLGGGAGDVVGAEHADDRGDAAQGEPAERDGGTRVW